MLPKRVVNNSAGGTIIVSNDATGLKTLSFFFPGAYFSCQSRSFWRLLVSGETRGSLFEWSRRCSRMSHCKQISLCSRALGAKNTSDRIWNPLLSLENSHVRQEDVQHQCHCGTSMGKEEGKHRESQGVCAWVRMVGGAVLSWWWCGWQNAKFIVFSYWNSASYEDRCITNMDPRGTSEFLVISFSISL